MFGVLPRDPGYLAGLNRLELESWGKIVIMLERRKRFLLSLTSVFIGILAAVGVLALAELITRVLTNIIFLGNKPPRTATHNDTADFISYLAARDCCLRLFVQLLKGIAKNQLL